MNRNQKSRLDRLEQAARMRGDTRRQAECSRASDEGILDGRTLEELLADPVCSLTLDDILFGEALDEANAAGSPTAEADYGMGNDR